jgi:hypothetical protein
LLALLTCSQVAPAETVIGNDQNVAPDSPEAWAMRTFAGTTLFTSFGETAQLAPWHFSAAFDLASIPHLSDAQQAVGFGGFKNEDLNRSPVFGRLRLALGLPHGGVVELGYTPPLEIDGSRPRNVFALAIGRRVLEHDAFTWSIRALGQVGDVRGDITCPARLAAVSDPLRNPYGCQAPSQDTFTTNYYGIDTTFGWDAGNWKWYGSVGIARAHLVVQVDALVFADHDRSRLTSNSNLTWVTAGVRHDFNAQWSLGVELLYLPLGVRRPPDYPLEQEPLTSLRMQLRYSAD